MPKKICFILLVFIFLSSCEEIPKSPLSVIDIKIDHHQELDSLIIYDKENAWEIKSRLHFIEKNIAIDTLSIIQNKTYQIYFFLNGKQNHLGEIMLSPGSKISIHLEEDAPYKSIKHSGNNSSINNFMAYSKRSQNYLSQKVKEGITSFEIEELIKEKKALIEQKSKLMSPPDSIINKVLNQYDHFSEILIQKNLKYLYKASLIDSIGNSFELKDIKNNTISLNQFYGKYVYIDVWTTWCTPCKAEYPHLKKLEKEFSKSKYIEIISISTDKDFTKWKNYVAKNNLGGNQLYAGENSEFVDFYAIGALPRFILLNPSGKIINADVSRPSDPKTSEMLTTLK